MLQFLLSQVTSSSTNEWGALPIFIWTLAGILMLLDGFFNWGIFKGSSKHSRSRSRKHGPISRILLILIGFFFVSTGIIGLIDRGLKYFFGYGLV